MMAEIQPMEQFLIHKVVAHPADQRAAASALSTCRITNSVATMIFAAAADLDLLPGLRRAGKVVPGRLQAFGEILYDLADKGLTGPMIGDRGRPFLPYVFALFCAHRGDEHLGPRPGQFTVTSQLAVTISLAVITFLMVVMVGFVRNGLGFFKLFVPGGIHWGMLLHGGADRGRSRSWCGR